MSKREYVISFIDAGIGFTERPVKLSDFMNPNVENEFEVIYALSDIQDEIMDLKVSESMYFQPNRDDKNTKGIILRVQ